MSSTTYNYKAIHVRESTKITELCDALNNLRYKVSLEPVQVPDGDGNLVTAYEIMVFSYFYGDEGIKIVPSTGEPRIIIFDYDEAFKRYTKYVIDYKALLKAQTKDIQDIDIYREKIDYKDTCPRCCATCRWCKKFKSQDDIIFGREGKFECWNPSNEKEFDFDYKDFNFPKPNPAFTNSSHFFSEPPPPIATVVIKSSETKIHPIVQPLGLCKRYEIASPKPEPRPMPGESINHMINRKIDFKLSGAISSTIIPEVSAAVTPIISTAVICNISSSISSEISSPVIQTINMFLSSPDASVALSAPIVNLITNSQTIQNQTINVIGDALSNNVLSDSMVPAVATTFTAPEISTAMIQPVANVIPTSSVSVNVLSVVENGITIEKIMGNDGITSRFIDKNRNGVQDPGEPDIDDSNITTVVLGGNLGA